MDCRSKGPRRYQKEHAVVDGATSSQWYEDVAIRLCRGPCHSFNDDRAGSNRLLNRLADKLVDRADGSERLDLARPYA